MKIEEHIRIKEIEIAEMQNAIERMNARATPETAMTVAVANDVFGGTVKELKGQLFDLKTEKAKLDKEEEFSRIMKEMGEETLTVK
jgi:predicted Zn-dependent protease